MCMGMGVWVYGYGLVVGWEGGMRVGALATPRVQEQKPGERWGVHGRVAE